MVSSWGSAQVGTLIVLIFHLRKPLPKNAIEKERPTPDIHTRQSREVSPESGETKNSNHFVNSRDKVCDLKTSTPEFMREVN